MHPGQVVVLLKVLADELPVGLDVEHLALLNPPLVEAVAGHAFRQVAEPDIELGGLVGEAGEEQRTPRANPHGDQTEVVAVEVIAGHLVEERGGLEAAVGAVAPAVVRATDRAGDVAVGFGEFGPAMAARVEEAAKLPIVAAGDHDRLLTDLTHEHAARLGDLAGDTDGDPRPFEDEFLFEGEEALVDIRRRVEAGRLPQRGSGSGPGGLVGPVGHVGGDGMVVMVVLVAGGSEVGLHTALGDAAVDEVVEFGPYGVVEGGASYAPSNSSARRSAWS